MNQQESVARLELHTIVAIPIDKLPMIETLDATISTRQGELLGVLYLDSHVPSSAFTDLDREVLRSLAREAATVVENARLFASSRAKQRLDHEIEIASQIQKTLLPKAMPNTTELSRRRLHAFVPLGWRRLLRRDFAGKRPLWIFRGRRFRQRDFRGSACHTASGCFLYHRSNGHRASRRFLARKPVFVRAKRRRPLRHCFLWCPRQNGPIRIRERRPCSAFALAQSRRFWKG